MRHAEREFWKGSRALVVAAVVAAIAFVSPSAALALPFGYVTQLASPNGCIGTWSGCTGGSGLSSYTDVTVSPDGMNAYVASYGSHFTGFSGVLQFSRAPSGALAQLPAPNDCVTFQSSGCGTKNAKGMSDPVSMVVSPDGNNVYVAAEGSDAVAEFSRNATSGALAQLGVPNDCITVNTSGCGITDVRGASNARGIAISPDGKNVYVAGDVLGEFARNQTTGALTPLASPNDCITSSNTGCGTTGANLPFPWSIVVSPDGKNVYVASLGGEAVSQFARSTTTGALTQLASPNDCIDVIAGGCDASGAGGPFNARQLAISPDGKTLYVAKGARGADPNGKLALLSRDPATGALSISSLPNDCVTAAATGCGLTGAAGLANPRAVAASADGKSVYAVAAQGWDGTLVEFERNSTTGALTQLPSPHNCLTSASSGCGTNGVQPLTGAQALGLSPEGDSVYVVTWTGGIGSIVEFARNAPACSPVTVTVRPDTSSSVPLTCTDPDDSALFRAIGAGPSHGTLGPIDQASGAVTYTPAPGYTGPDSFTFSADDGALVSDPATATLSVQAAPASGPAATPGGPTDSSDNPQGDPGDDSSSDGGSASDDGSPPAPVIRRTGRPALHISASGIRIQTGYRVHCLVAGPSCRVQAAAVSARSALSSATRSPVLARTRFYLPAGRSRSVVLNLSGSGQRALFRTGRLTVYLQIAAQAGRGDAVLAISGMVLQAPQGHRR